MAEWKINPPTAASLSPPTPSVVATVATVATVAIATISGIAITAAVVAPTIGTPSISPRVSMVVVDLL
jgi:hypothetical protein